MNLVLGSLKIANWVLPFLVCVAGCYVLFAQVPYAVGYGVYPVSLLEVSRSMWFGFSDWTHGILVFPLTGLILFLKRKELFQIPVKGSWLGLPVLLIAVLLYWFGYLTDLQYVGFLAIQIFVAGLILWFLGTLFFGHIFFVWAFLLFAWPFVFLDQYVSFPLRLFMTTASGHLLNLIGVSNVRAGTAILSAPDPAAGLAIGQRFSVDIADPCSGIHSLFALTMIAALYAIIMFRRWWQILLVVASAFPLAVLGNICRILMLTFGTMLFGSSFAIGTLENPTWFHTGAGFLVYVAALAGVFCVGCLVGKVARTTSPDTVPDTEASDRAIGPPNFFPPLGRSLVVVVVTGLAAGLIYLGRDMNQDREAGVNMSLPDSLPGYLGFEEAPSEAELHILPKDTEFAKKRYVGSAPVDVRCEIVLSGAAKSSIHRPQVCLIAQGWTIYQEQTIPITLANGHSQEVRVLTIGRKEEGKVFTGYLIYWYVGKDRTTADNFKRILLTSWDRVVRRVNHRWAYVTISGALPGGSDSESANKRLLNDLVDFTRGIIPVIQQPQVFQGSLSGR
jgi:exosortase